MNRRRRLVSMAAGISRHDEEPDEDARDSGRPVWPAVGATFAVTAGVLLLRHAMFGTDHVGIDNDDTMRLVQVRDLLAGQGWFDLQQYRLGLEGGTPMHWSRLIDLPVANLITLFNGFTDAARAEALALAVWPLMTLLGLFYGMGLAGRRLAGDHGLFGALVLTAMFAFASNRFAPGSIDHHNAQMALAAIAVAGLVDPHLRKGAFAAAGVVTALAIAIGAEIVPQMAVLCAAVAALWAARGEAARHAAQGFGLALAATLTAVFFATVPAARYGEVVCDAYSTGFYALGTLGGGLLFLVSALAPDRKPAQRAAALGLAGLVVAGAVLLVAPHCLQSPLAGLDPMLRTHWLDLVTEAQSVFGVWRRTPELFAGQYLLPVVALGIAIAMARAGRNRQANLILAALVAVAYAISLVQVRGAVFANLVALLVFTQLIAGARGAMRADPKSGRKGMAFCLAVLLSAQVTWMLAGIGAAKALEMATGEDVTGRVARGTAEDAPADVRCRQGPAMAALAAEPDGVVSAVSNIGDDILRHTRHRVLSAPYHRNQGGMLTQFHIAMEPPASAVAFLRGAGVSLLVHCPADPETRTVARQAPEGLFAALEAGRVPDYLERVDGGGVMHVYRVKPPTR
jgi:hypothetical protein